MSLRDEIAEIIYGEHHKNDITWQNCRPKADRVLSLIESHNQDACDHCRYKHPTREVETW